MDKVKALPTLKWLIQSFEVTDYKGSAHNYSHWLNKGNGWSNAYPETTGYIINTLVNYDSYFPELRLKELAIQQAYWLMGQQLDSGAFQSGKIGSDKTPSIFNSGQILFGLMDGWKLTEDSAFEIAITKCIDWLIDQLDKESKWSQFNWVQDYNPTYLTRVIWPIILASDLLEQDQWKQWIYPCYEYYGRQQNNNYTFKNWGFHSDKPAFTHTIAYTLRGLLESAILLDDRDQIINIEGTAFKMIEIYQSRGLLAGSYSEEWQGDYSFICVSGHAQLSVLYSRLFEITKKEIYKEMSKNLLKDIRGTSQNSMISSINGAIPGSTPIYGKYNRLRYPNWAAKFYLDALAYF